MTNSRTLRVETPEDLLALVPCTLGFHPEESLVVVAVDGAARHCQARVDLPENADQISAVASQIPVMLSRNEVRRVVLVAYTDDQLLAEKVVNGVGAGLEDVGVEVMLAIRADGQRWFSLVCDDPCCPAEGTPYNLSSHPFTVQSVVDGRVVLRNRAELADTLVTTDPDAIDAVAAAAEEHTLSTVASARHPLGPPAPETARRRLAEEARWVADRVRRYLLHRERFDDAEAARMLADVSLIELRDVAWAQMRRDDAERHVELWRDLLRRSPHGLVPAPAALLGFAAWLNGDGALAWCAVERCQEVDPDYRLADLLTRALMEALPPTSWEPPGADTLAGSAGQWAPGFAEPAVPLLFSHGRRGRAAGVLATGPDPVPREGATVPRRVRPDASGVALRGRRPDDRSGDRAEPRGRRGKPGAEER